MMNVLQEKCFTKEWLNEQREQMYRVDPGLLEKSIHALELVGHLARYRLPFVFKGGTCMLLLLDEIRRLSIDVDIVCTVSGTEMESVLRAIGRESRFENVESDHRDPDRLPKRSHYKFSYLSVVNGKSADILLDVLEEKCLYPKTVTKPVVTPFAIPENQFEVQVPTIEGLTADKLTAFAPETVGVRYSAYGASLKILKHCADVGVLFDRCENMPDLFDAYEKSWTAENSYRGRAFTREQILNDTIKAARLLNLIGLKGCPVSKNIKTLETGIRQLDSHIVGRRFSRDEAKICAAKAAWLAAALKRGEIATIPRYSTEELQDLAVVQLKGDYVPLNRLKAGNPQAWYYWLKSAGAV
ncbi:MAG: nucleotidyl transferase AbiEii/AbiGii toxin family protein [Kiritimatiellae bacterium]|nr:nucleotidyl transferase AbiEii/AbiGii toxin family protein [Kiritimatiellia bacterium]MDD4735215.1 nucleotidyl transferase AbiEii/AbiGii toxin family protein [Kiritimatiellia bacterium]